MSGEMDDRDLMSFAHELADAAGRAIMPYFRKSPDIDDKAAGGGRYDPVTEADRAGEQAMRELIARRFPGHGVNGEEFGADNIDAEHVWHLDPIDGTRSFIIGMPVWGTLIGLTRGGKPHLGIMDQPYLNERFYAMPGLSELRHGSSLSRLRTGSCAELAEARLATTDPHLFAAPGDAAVFKRLRETTRLTRYGGDCYFYAMLAAGQVDLVVESGLKPHDIVALIAIIEQAGGVVSGWRGEPAADGGTVLAAANPALHASALSAIAS